MAEYIDITDLGVGVDEVNTDKTIILAETGIGIDTLEILDITEIVNKYRVNKSKEDAIYDWVIASLGADTVVIWDKPNAPRPSLPYVTLNIIGGPVMVGDRPNVKYKELDTWTYQFKNKMTLSVNILGYSDHLSKMNTLLRSLYLASKVEILNLAGMACWGADGPRDFSVFMDTEWEFRSQADIFLSYGEDVDDVPGEIQKIEINGQIIEIP